MDVDSVPKQRGSALGGYVTYGSIDDEAELVAADGRRRMHSFPLHISSNRLQSKKTKAAAWCRRPTQQLADDLAEDNDAPIVVEVVACASILRFDVQQPQFNVDVVGLVPGGARRVAAGPGEGAEHAVGPLHMAISGAHVGQQRAQGSIGAEEGAGGARKKGGGSGFGAGEQQGGV
jgi:hypothetical protein